MLKRGAKQSHDKALRMVLEWLDGERGRRALYIFFSPQMLDWFIFKGLKNILFSSSFLCYMLEEHVIYYNLSSNQIRMSVEALKNS